MNCLKTIVSFWCLLTAGITMETEEHKCSSLKDCPDATNLVNPLDCVTTDGKKGICIELKDCHNLQNVYITSEDTKICNNKDVQDIDIKVCCVRLEFRSFSLQKPQSYIPTVFVSENSSLQEVIQPLESGFQDDSNSRINFNESDSKIGEVFNNFTKELNKQTQKRNNVKFDVTESEDNKKNNNRTNFKDKDSKKANKNNNNNKKVLSINRGNVSIKRNSNLVNVLAFNQKTKPKSVGFRDILNQKNEITGVENSRQRNNIKVKPQKGFRDILTKNSLIGKKPLSNNLIKNPKTKSFINIINTVKRSTDPVANIKKKSRQKRQTLNEIKKMDSVSPRLFYENPAGIFRNLPTRNKNMFSKNHRTKRHFFYKRNFQWNPNAEMLDFRKERHNPSARFFFMPGPNRNIYEPHNYYPKEYFPRNFDHNNFDTEMWNDQEFPERDRPIFNFGPRNGENECGRESRTKSSRIMGGMPVALGEYPWMVLIQYAGTNRVVNGCGGSLITSNFILTAAHCVDSVILKLRNIHLYRVILGEFDTHRDPDCLSKPNKNVCAEPYRIFNVESIITHPDFDRVNALNDVALLKLDKDVTFSDYIKPICLPPRDFEFNANEIVLVAGWGRTEVGGNYSNTLNKAILPIVEKDVCRRRGVTLNDGQVCLGLGNGVDTCTGDSGGPMMTQRLDALGLVTYLFGIISYGFASEDCGRAPSVNTYVPYYLEWINEILQDG